MTGQQFRWTLLAIASGLITFVVLRRRQQIAAALPQPILEQAERFVIPWPGQSRTATDTADETALDDGSDEGAAADDEPENSDSMRRKVSSTYRISFHGKRYGPLPESLAGQYVEVETRDDTLYVLHDGTPVANFQLAS